MFEIQLVVSERHKTQKGMIWIIPLVVFLHVVILATVTVAQYWTLETVPEPPIQVSFFQATPPPPPPPPPPPKATVAPPKVEVAPPTVVTQPVEVPEKAPEAAPDTGMEGFGVEGGVEGGVPGGVMGGLEGGVVGGVPGGVPGPEVKEEILRVGGDVTKPELIRAVQPVYPEIARRARISGVVIVEAIIDQNGTVTNARILKSLPMGLAEAAVEAVKQWRYKPATLNGRPVAVYFTLTVNFKLQ